jgi:hypothetical protein
LGYAHLAIEAPGQRKCTVARVPGLAYRFHRATYRWVLSGLQASPDDLQVTLGPPG